MMGIKLGNGGWREWHIGEALPPECDERVVTMQLDGDELNLVLGAMHISAQGMGNVYRIEYSKQRGFFIEINNKPKG